MSRRKKIDRPRKVIFSLPGSIIEKMEAELYSEIEGRVPYSARSNLVAELLREWLQGRGIVV